jgi:hypothetical protein
MASIRLALATEHLSALSRLLTEPPTVYASATVARGVLENAARGSWALDPSLNVKLRIARGRTDNISNLLDVLKYPRPVEPTREDGEEEAHFQERVAEFDAFTAEFDKAQGTLDAVLADTDAIGLNIIRDRRGRFQGVERPSPGPTDTIRMEFGDEGAIAYRNLSGVAHGGLSSLLYRMEPAEAADARSGSTLMKPAEEMGSQLSFLAVALNAYSDAQRRRIALFGWDATSWNAWLVTTAQAMRELYPAT